METEDETQLLPHLPLALESGDNVGVRQLGETLSFSPALQAPGLWGRKVMGGRAQPPSRKGLREGPLQGLRPLTNTSARGR